MSPTYPDSQDFEDLCRVRTYEEQLGRNKILVFKFWLAISKEEQLRRFKEREKIGFKKFKLTEEDWRNREKWDEYCRAINTTVAHTSTSNAPWTLVPANSKYYARIDVLKTVCEMLESALV